MNIHKNARLTVVRRRELGHRANRPGADISALAREFGVSRRTVYTWQRRYRAGEAALRDRSSRPHRCPRRVGRVRRRQIARRRRQGWSSCRIASDLRLPIASVVREQRRLGLARLAALTPPRPIVRYEWPRAGDLLHLDVKKLGRIGRVGHRIHGDRRRATRGIGWEYTHVAVDDASRVAYAEVLPDETGATTVGFLRRALAFFRARGVRVRRLLTDNGTNYRSRDFRRAVATHALVHKRTRPYTPRTNGKAERFIRTMLQLWAYTQAYRFSAWRTLALPRFLQYYNHQRGHYGIRGLTPHARLAQVL
ncbi:MAG: IS481 family transposase [Gemmatimonadaceae bacterium]